MNRLERMPVPVLPTFVGTLTLSNVYGGLGYSWVRNLCMAAGTIILLLYLIKIIRYPRTCLGEYQNTIPCSLYAAFDMIMMILGSYYYTFVPALGAALLNAAICIHVVHILVFTYRNVIRERNINTTMPSWFVTYNGIMVSCVVGSEIGPRAVLTAITYYGIVIYLILIPIMIWRMLTVEVKPAVYHTMAVVLAPCSLCLVSYLNIISSPIPALVYFLYACVLASLLFIVVKLPKFFAFPFSPGFAGLTFPMAIGIVATNKMTAYLTAGGKESLAAMTGQLSGIQLYLTTMIIGYVLLNFVIMALRIQRR